VVHRLKKDGFHILVKIAGDGPLRDDLESQARELGIEDTVEFVGQTIDVPKLMSEGAILVHTSDSEGYPNVVMEAMASGRPVVATNVGDTSRLIEDGRTGFLVQAGDDEALTRRLAVLLTDRNLRESMGQAARTKAEREFSLSRLVDQTLIAYRSCGWRDWQ
jgi:glycosyltransferase involved in cell wall biosynthesis